MDEKSFQINYRPLISDLSHFNFSDEKAAILQIVLSLCFVVVFWGHYFFSETGGNESTDGLFLTISLILLSLAGAVHGIYLYRRASDSALKKEVEQAGKVSISGSPLLEFSEAGLRLSAGSMIEELRWSDLLSVVETKRTLNIHLDEERSLKIPIADLDKGNRLEKTKAWILQGGSRNRHFLSN